MQPRLAKPHKTGRDPVHLRYLLYFRLAHTGPSMSETHSLRSATDTSFTSIPLFATQYIILLRRRASEAHVRIEKAVVELGRGQVAGCRVASGRSRSSTSGLHIASHARESALLRI